MCLCLPANSQIFALTEREAGTRYGIGSFWYNRGRSGKNMGKTRESQEEEHRGGYVFDIEVPRFERVSAQSAGA